MSDDDASSLGDYALDSDEEADDSHSRRCSAQALRIGKPERSSSLRGSAAHVSKLEGHLNHVAKDTSTESCTSRCKQEDQRLMKRRPSKRKFSAGPPTDTEMESICKDARSWITSERLGTGTGDKIGEEDEEAIDRSMFEMFKIDVDRTVPMKFVKRKLNDATAKLDAFAKEAVQEAFEKGLQEITSAAWQRMQDARASGRQCAIADEFLKKKTAEVDEQKRHYLQMQTKYLKEVSMHRDHLNHGRSEKIKETGINLQMWNPLEDLDAETHALVLACSEEQLKTHLTAESELREALECKVKAAEDALAHAQNRAHEQAIDIAKLREEVTQHRDKSVQNNALPVSSNSKDDVSSEKQIVCEVCGAHVAIPTHLVNDLQNRVDLDTAAKLPVTLREKKRVLSLSSRKSVPLASLVSGSQNFSGTGNEHDEQANNQNGQAAEEQAGEIHKQSDLPADACASGHSDFDLQQVADIGCEDSGKLEDGLQTARAPRRISTVTSDFKAPATARRSSRSKSTKIHSSTTYYIDSGARRSSFSGNPEEKSSLMVSGAGARRKCSLPHVTPPTHDERESQLALAAQDSAADVHNQHRDLPITKPSFSKSSGKSGAVLGRNAKSPAERATMFPSPPMGGNSVQVPGSTTRVQSWESGLSVSSVNTRPQTWESGLEIPGSTPGALSPEPESGLEAMWTPRQERISQASTYSCPSSSTWSIHSPEDSDLMSPAAPVGRHGAKLSSGRWSQFVRLQKK